jgi:hypothetical protein
VTSALVALASTLLAALVAAAAYLGAATLVAAAIAVCLLLLALGWASLLELPDPRGTTLTIGASGAAAAGVGLVLADRKQPLTAFAVLIAGSVLLAFVHELARRDGRPGLVESVTGTLSGQVIAVLGAGWVLLPSTALGKGGVYVAAAAVIAASIGLVLPVDQNLRGWVAFAAGTAAAGATTVATAPTNLAEGLVLGVAVAGVVAGMGLLLRAQRTTRTVLGLLAAGAAPVCAIGTVAFAVARLGGG